MASRLAFDAIGLPSGSASLDGLAAWCPSFGFVRASLVATLLAAPLAFGAVQEWAWGALAVLAFLLLLCWAIASVQHRSLTILWSPLYWPGALFFLLVTIQFAGGRTMDLIATREALLKLSTDLILFFLAGQVLGGPAFGAGQVKGSPTWSGPARAQEMGACALSDSALRGTIVVYTFVLALFAILQFFSSQGMIYWTVKSPGWTFGPYVNHNHYAGLMEMLIPLSVASALPVLRKQGASAIVGCLIMIPIASLLLSGSRGGVISLLLEALLASVLIFLYGPRRARRPMLLLGGAAILTAALLFFWMAPSRIADRLASVGDVAHPAEAEWGNRLAAAQGALGIFRDHPWLGVGLGSFETAFPRYQSFPSDLRWDHAHNDYAEALAETGVAGGGLMLCALGLFFWLAFRNLRQRLRGPAGWMQCGAAIGCCGLLLHSFADFNLHMPANAAWFVVCVAVATRTEPG